ncbi:manganese ABC transporter [Klebsiella pneumoniae]|uniref:Manganese ABC transporter n=1 Tax=Klebsiella pneumoniae TaxID=573 RepID=A0A3S4GJS0_KLEPN|nr:manganese ABC transporter [Klebsiella pneumoniae]
MLHLTSLKSLLLASALALLAATPASAQEKFRVITTFTVIADMAQNVAGDAAVVSSITKPGAEIHDYQPTPGDIKRAQGAQLILSNGLNLERWFARFLSALTGRSGGGGQRGDPADGHQRGSPIAGSPIPMPGCRQITP